MAKLSEEFIFEYFSQLNPIAYKIQAEINQAIENYEHYWNNLDKREQMTIINEAVIKPEIQLNYQRRTKDVELEHPYRDIDASLLNFFLPRPDVDRPFSYKTRSQENLFYSFNPPTEDEPITSAVRIPVLKPKQNNNHLNKSTDSLTCVNFVNLNVKPKKGRAPAVPTKMNTKPPPPPPPTAKKVADFPQKDVPVVVAPVLPAAVPVAIEEHETETLPEISKIPEDNNSNTSLLSPADELETPTNSHIPITEHSDDEFKSLLDTNGFDFLNNW